MTADYERLHVNVGGAQIEVLRGGRGPSLVALHSIEGSMGWLPMYRQLAEHFTVYAPTHPGYFGSQRPAGVESFIDLARFYPWILQELQIGKATLVGHFIGGWLAAEMATMCPEAVQRLVLIDAAGIKPERGEIADIFLHGIEATRSLSFHAPAQVPDYDALFPPAKSTEQRERQTANREATTRYCWKPYAHDPLLPLLLRRVGIPTLIVWGREDRIVPLECGELYHAAIAGSRLAIIDRCGHFPQFERPEEFNNALLEFVLRK